MIFTNHLQGYCIFMTRFAYTTMRFLYFTYGKEANLT